MCWPTALLCWASGHTLMPLPFPRSRNLHTCLLLSELARSLSQSASCDVLWCGAQRQPGGRRYAGGQRSELSCSHGSNFYLCFSPQCERRSDELIVAVADEPASTIKIIALDLQRDDSDMQNMPTQTCERKLDCSMYVWNWVGRKGDFLILSWTALSFCRRNYSRPRIARRSRS